MKPRLVWISSVIVLGTVLALLLVTGLSRAQEGAAPEPSNPEMIAPGAIPVQCRLTSANGTPLNGTYPMVFALYTAVSDTVPLCTDYRDVNVMNGLFNDVIDHCYNSLNGQKVWLGVKVGSDTEMLPRQVIYPAPYALSLVPGAFISTTIASPLSLRSTSASAKVLEATSSAGSGTTYGVYATSNSPGGYGGYFYNNSSGTGVAGVSVAGPGVFAGSLGTSLRSNSSTGAAIAWKAQAASPAPPNRICGSAVAGCARTAPTI